MIKSLLIKISLISLLFCGPCWAGEFETTSSFPTVVVTCATGELGREIAELLASDCNLVLAGRNMDKLTQLQKKLSDEHPEHEYEIVQLDYSDSASIGDFQGSLWKRREIHGLVLITPRPDFKKNALPEQEEWLQQFQATFTGPCEVFKTALPFLQPGAKVVIMNGVTSVQFMPEYGPTCVIRRMWSTFAKALSHQFGPRGISINSISPGIVLTSFHEERIEKKAEASGLSYEEQMLAEVAHIPLRRHAYPSEVARAVRFLLSEESNFVSGVNLVLDGGATVSY